MKTVIGKIKKAHSASRSFQVVSSAITRKLLLELASAIMANKTALLKANSMDVALQEKGDPKVDRLLLTETRIKGIADSLRKVAKLPDPSGKVIEERKIEQGLKLQKVTVPMGVVAAIYESRPNVTFDIAGLCIRSKNACVLKGSTDAKNTNEAAVKIIKSVLKQNGVNPDIVTLLPPEREVVGVLFEATEYVDVIIPRGSAGLIEYVRKNSRVPVIETGAGVCHVYIHSKANLEKAVNIAINARVSRPTVCNSADTFLVDASISKKFLKLLQASLKEYKVEVFADKLSYEIMQGYPLLKRASKEHYGKEFLSLKCSIKVVKGMEDALNHIASYGTKHSEAIVTEDKKMGELFLQSVDAAAVYLNASTRFTDGEVFGLGAEIGISTQKLHARGPFALEKLVTEKWVIRGNGQVR
jgi:glutamate-5-semialdehyde dehydrogenase